MGKKIEFKGTKDGIVLQYDNVLNFAELISGVEKKLRQANYFFSGETIIGIEGKTLLPEEETKLTKLIQDLGDMHVQTLKNIERVAPSKVSSVQKSKSDSGEDSIKRPDLNNAKKDVLPQTHAPYDLDSASDQPSESDITTVGELINEDIIGERAIIHRGTLRSGGRLESEGHIILLGDANPGSELSAAGNIIVMGALRGFAQAGKYGDDTCYIVALKLNPTQIRIGKRITRAPDGGNASPDYPEMALVKDNQIIIEPYK